MVRKVAANVILTAALAALCVAALSVANRLGAPRERVLSVGDASPPDYAALVADVSPQSLREDLEAFAAWPSRFSGSPGCEQAADYIGRKLTALGYQVLEQPLHVTVPVTKEVWLKDASGGDLAGVRIYPLLPNAFRTVTTPPEGIRGTVYVGREGLAREFKEVPLERNIVLLPLGKPWTTVAGMGAGAVLYYDDAQCPDLASSPGAAAGEPAGPGPKAGPPAEARESVGSNWPHHIDASLDLPRFMVTGDVRQLVGRTVILKARVDFEQRAVRNVIGLLKAGAGTQAPEAILLSAHYDSFSFAPDLAPGADQACGPAVLLAAARHLGREPKALKRSVVLVFTAGHGQGLVGIREFAGVLGPQEARAEALAKIRAEDREAQEMLRVAQRGLEIARSGEYWSVRGEKGEESFWSARPREDRKYFAELAARALDDLLMEAVERTAERRVEWVRCRMAIRDGAGHPAPSFVAYEQAHKAQQQLASMLATPLVTVKERWADFLADRHVPEKVTEEAHRRLAEIEFEGRRAAARAQLAARLARFRRVIHLALDLTSRSGRLGLATGEKALAQTLMPADLEVEALVRQAAERLGQADPGVSYRKTADGEDRFLNLLRENESTYLPFVNASTEATLCFESSATAYAGYPSFSLVTVGDLRREIGSPADGFDRILSPRPAGGREVPPLANLCHAARLVVGAVSSMARGRGRIIPASRASDLYTVSGEVVSQVGEGLTPSHRMPGALVRIDPRFWEYPLVLPPGVGRDILVTADWNGRFALPGVWGTALSVSWQNLVDLDAAIVRPEDGQVTWTLSIPKSGPTGSFSKARKVPIATFNRSRASLVVFRASPIALFPLVDPTTLQAYAGLDFVEKKSLAAPQDFKTESAEGANVCFVAPEVAPYFTFKKGKKSNPNLMEIRAFATNTSGPADGSECPPDQDLCGEGYLAADHPRIINIELDASLSVAQTDARRIRAQQASGLSDEALAGYADQAVRFADSAQEKRRAGRVVDAKKDALVSLAYSTNIHPVIRENASDAIVGILFYLLLAMPFAFFLEKLLVGHPDLRWQIVIQGVIFLAYFLALRAVHPAYQLVHSSYMILLGFVSFTLAAVVSIFVAQKFSRNVTELTRRMHQQVATAEVTSAGAAATAFLLGLSNMRKRAVRTGLTMTTLLLITFVMICFTSVRTDLVDVEFPVGKASYTGLLVRDRNLADIAAALPQLRELYGEEHLVAPRAWGGKFKLANPSESPELPTYAVTTVRGEKAYDATANALLGLSVAEAGLTPIRQAFPALRRWFESDQEYSVMLSRPMADQLRITDEEVLQGKAAVKFSGRPYAVLGIFDPAKLDALLDLDGQPILPLDILSARQPGTVLAAQYAEEATNIPEDVPRLPARGVLLMPWESMPVRTQLGSIAVGLQGLDYAAASELITSCLERLGEPTYYGRDGIAYYGGKFRMASLEGFLDMLLPIVLVGLTVLNTMRGSVYERKGELFVFNAVGLAPHHIRWLFLAEASVYAVVGSVGGYLLAQALGSVLGAMHWTAGLTMNYSSLSAVFVSVVIMAVVFASSIFPARMASHLAAPAETMTRRRQTAAGEVMEFDLPFTFNPRDRVAIVPYFVDWFENYGEGSSGGFFCSRPECGVRDEGGRAAPYVQTTTWLRPYDLGVSQKVELLVRHDPQSGDNVATVVMTRTSGDHQSWERCCHAFIGMLRKRFLTWRAVSEADRHRLLERGRELLDPRKGQP